MPSLGHRLPVCPQNEAASSISLNARIYIDKDDKGSARAFYSIMQVNPASVEFLAVDTAEREIWELVAKAMKLQPGAVKGVVTTKAALGIAVRTRSSAAKRNHIKDVLDAVGPRGFTVLDAVGPRGSTINSPGILSPAEFKGIVSVKVEKSETGWARLEQIMDTSQEEFEMK